MKHLNIIILLTVLMSMVVVTASAHDIAVKNADGVTIYYSWTNNKTKLSVTYRGSSHITSRCYSGNVVIPESVTYDDKTYNVTSIGVAAFYTCSGLTSITIPKSVSSIERAAFRGCSDLTSITIPNSVTSIGESAFEECSGLTSIIIGNGVTSIGNYAFEYCSSLTSITIPNSVKSIGDYAFKGCSGLTSLIIGSGVRSIGYTAFNNCSGLTSIKVASENAKYDSRDNCNAIIETASNSIIVGCKSTIITNSVTSIGEKAFYGCSGLTSITIPNNITNIEYGAFSGCIGLTSVTIDSNEIISQNYTENSSLKYIFGSQVKNYILGESVTSIGGWAFYGCSGLTTVTISNSVTSIGYGAFNGCMRLTSITIPNSVTSIGDYAFDVTQLKSVTIGSGVLSIGKSAFPTSGVRKPIKVIWLTNSPPTNYSNAAGTVNYVANNLYTRLSNKTVYPFLSSMFEIDGIKYVPVSPSERTCDAIDCVYDASAKNITIGESVTNKGVSLKIQKMQPYVCYDNTYVKSVNIESSFKGDIPHDSFYGCTGITSATINNQGSIDASAFQGCTDIISATISNQGDIGEMAFYGCATEYPATFTITNNGSVGTSAFEGCSAITQATVSNQGSVGEKAFYGCATKNPATFSITNNGSIGASAFGGCTALLTAELGSNIPSIGNDAFSGCSSLQSIDIPDAVKALGSSAFFGCSSMTSAKIGNGIGLLNISTFSGCTSLTDVTIGTGVKTMDGSYSSNTYNGCFNNCSALVEIKIPKNVTAIKDYVFKGCSSLTKVTMEDSEEELSLGSNGSSPMFADCPLDEVYIGRNISYSKTSSKGYSPFYRNTSLRSVIITDKETEISANEFYGCTNLKEVKIGDGVTDIGNWAFSGCSSLDYFSFGSAVSEIGQEAFSDCTAMTKLITKAMTPPNCLSQALDDINKWNCTLHVPKGTAPLYRQAAQWKEFFFIDDDAPTAINDVNGNENMNHKVKSIFSIDGKPLAKPQKGMNIQKMSDGTVRKIVVQ